MPTFNGTLKFTPAELDSATARLRQVLPGAERLKSLVLDEFSAKAKAVVDAPILGEIAIEASLEVDESG